MFVSSYIKAGYPCLYIRSTEQERAMDEISIDLKKNDLSNSLVVYTWRCTTGLIPYLSDKPANDQVAYDLVESFKYIKDGTNGETPENKLYVIFNPKKFLTDNLVAIQALRDAAYAIRLVGSHIIMVGGGIDLPEELEDVMTFVDFDLPSKEDLKKAFRGITDNYKDIITGEITDDLLEVAAENACGLTHFKAENAIALSIVEASGIDISLLRKEKQLAIKQSGVLEYVPHDETSDTLGGFDTLKGHVAQRIRFFSDHKKAVDFGLRPPKGIMLVGLPGTGKSLASKAIATSLNLPLYRFNVGALFKGIVGASESATRQALKLIESVAPCCLVLDEMEKLVAGLESSGKTDSGVTSRVIGSLLTWMQETTAPIYKVATCNTIRNLDAALFRRGRWDAVFAVDLPTSLEREQIFSIHLKKRKRSPKSYDLAKLSTLSDGFVGAEIESAVEEALYRAFDQCRELEMADMEVTLKSIVPISKTDKEAITSFQTWMKERATSVSAKPEAPVIELGVPKKAGRAIRAN